MGLSGISPGSLLLILLIVLLFTGGNKIRNIGEDLGVALRSFKKALNDDEQDPKDKKSKLLD